MSAVVLSGAALFSLTVHVAPPCLAVMVIVQYTPVGSACGLWIIHLEASYPSTRNSVALLSTSTVYGSPGVPAGVARVRSTATGCSVLDALSPARQ